LILALSALVVGAADWVAVARRRKSAEYVLKPLTMVVLIAAAAVLGGDEPGARWQFTVAALVLSLAGDVFLMLPNDLFLPGLASFLLAHVAYVAAFNPAAAPFWWVVGAAVGLLLLVTPIYVLLFRGMRRSGQQEMAVPVAVYTLALGAVVASAVATAGRAYWGFGRAGLAILAAVLFAVSDGLIGWTRFVKDYSWAPVAIIATYHLAQVGLVIALLG
jgi:uncharacterized membrane protein YhhN